VEGIFWLAILILMVVIEIITLGLTTIFLKMQKSLENQYFPDFFYFTVLFYFLHFTDVFLTNLVY